MAEDAGSLRPSEQQTREATVEGFRVRLSSHRLGTRFVCHVDNIEPGAVIGRGNGLTRADAEAAALRAALSKLYATAARRIFEDASEKK